MSGAFTRPIRSLGKLLLDFALPARCAGCAEVIEEVGAFCPACWGRMEWLGNAGASAAACRWPGPKSRHAGASSPIRPGSIGCGPSSPMTSSPRSIALRLKYGRKVALARTMARYMAPLKSDWDSRSMIIPVPLHRWRLRSRGFNQSGLISSELGKSWGLVTHSGVLRRVRRTQPLKGMNHVQQRKVVAGAFAVADADRIKGRTVVLIDDVLTSGSTAGPCAKVLRRAGASRIELICWARVVRPAQLMR